MDESLKAVLQKQGQQAKKASRLLAVTPTTVKNQALLAMADELEKEQDQVMAANAIDLQQGEKNGLTPALLERLMLDQKRIHDMAQGLREVAALPDPIGEVLGMTKRPNGLEIGRVRTPLGVIGIIYESRPNVTADAAALCVKAGNAILLRGGEEALHSNRVITRLISQAGEREGLPAGSIQLIDSEDRDAVIYMLQMNDHVDVVIPRGGKGLKKAVIEHATVPVIMTGMGNCHVYVDEFADLAKAVPIIINAKVQRPSVCNAAEKMLVHQKVAAEFLPVAVKELQEAGVEIRGCEQTRSVVPGLKAAQESDWDEEYLDLILAVRVVDSLDEAIEHINQHGTGHSEAIVSQNYSNVRRFLAAVDAAAVYANASTRFTDGNVFGFGAEVGISTQKLHTRGPMGLNELTTTKFIIYGDGQIR